MKGMNLKMDEIRRITPMHVFPKLMEPQKAGT
jgi:hypothetical protein